MLELIRRDVARQREIWNLSLTRAIIELALFDSGFQALFLYRLGHAARDAGIPLLPALTRRLSVALCSVDILPKAQIGPGCLIAHGIGLVIGGDVVIGAECTLLHGVTLGEARFEIVERGPRVGDRVTIGAGAKVLGAISIGDDAVIGANAVVLDDVPAGATAAGIPARIISRATTRD